mmetsp:Transcript_65028/g.139275  ORF Transcript_65028/g.139275 Transcript_65028/m.139275 type:complete len:80 (+) Transcript_65028:919-1158(+)
MALNPLWTSMPLNMRPPVSRFLRNDNLRSSVVTFLAPRERMKAVAAWRPKPRESMFGPPAELYTYRFLNQGARADQAAV